MKLQFETESMFALGLNVKQVALLQLLEKQKELKKFESILDITEKDIEKLKKMNLIKEDSFYGNLATVRLTKKFIAKNTDYFEEFYKLYPSRVTRIDGGIDTLKLYKDRCKTRYNNIIGMSEEKHKRMMEALRAEIRMRESTNSMCWFKRMYKWLEGEEWENAIEQEKVLLTIGAGQYGVDIE